MRSEFKAAAADHQMAKTQRKVQQQLVQLLEVSPTTDADSGDTDDSGVSEVWDGEEDGEMYRHRGAWCQQTSQASPVEAGKAEKPASSHKASPAASTKSGVHTNSTTAAKSGTGPGASSKTGATAKSGASSKSKDRQIEKSKALAKSATSAKSAKSVGPAGIDTSPAKKTHAASANAAYCGDCGRKTENCECAKKKMAAAAMAAQLTCPKAAARRRLKHKAVGISAFKDEFDVKVHTTTKDVVDKEDTLMAMFSSKTIGESSQDDWGGAAWAAWTASDMMGDVLLKIDDMTRANAEVAGTGKKFKHHRRRIVG
jgi:hypothetical protein